MNTIKKSDLRQYAAAFISGSCLLALSTQSVRANDSVAEQIEQQAAKYPSTTNYIIRRKGKRVGTHSVEFSTLDSRLNVSVESNITITILKVPVFKFEYTATEQWENGRLVNVTARTNNGGDITNAEYTPASSEDVVYSSNHWNPDVLTATEVFNTLTGNMSKVSIESMGNERLQDDSSTINADRYRYSGDIKADVWYDESNRWVKLEFQGEDGSVISYTADPLDFTP